ncbi:winged helix-turn-helix transcriptional regulator [Candidatus Microgenomates bacterium]|nr:winged helix-turn-helix transcriptional regulator [Candidatus Microgenomates bacterium]
MLSSRELERYVRGFSNHRRIDILKLLAIDPDLSLEDISRALDANYKTINDHTRRLSAAGLIKKRNRGAAVEHALTKRGRFVLKFLRTLS